MEMPDQQRNKKSEIPFAIANIINSLWIFYIYLIIAPIGSYPPANFSKILEGTADRPFIYRALVPLIAKAFSWLLPDELIHWMGMVLPAPMKIVFDRLGGETHAKEAVIALSAMFVSLIAFGFAEKVFTKLIGLNGRMQFILPLFAQALILPFSYHFGFYYDLPQILLVTLNLIFLYRQNWPAYLILFAVTTLNKETSITLTIIFGLYFFSRIPREKFIKLLGGQIVIYSAIRTLLIFLYRDNPGADLPSKFGTQLYIYTSFPIILFITLLFFGIIFFFILKKWGKTDLFLRTSLAMFAVIFILFFSSGIPMEFRVFLETLPFLAIWIFPLSTI